MGIKFDENKEPKKPIEGDKKSFLNREISIGGSSFSNKAKEEFYGELSVLLKSGINLKSALDLIHETQTKKKHQELVKRIANTIIEGKSLSEAMENDKHFTPYEFQAVKIGEQTGQLAKITDDLRAYFSRKNELRRQLISSLSYPFIVLITAVLVIFFMLKYVVPMFEDIFKQNNVKLPWLTEQIVALSNLFTSNLLVLMILFVGMIVLLKWMSTTQWYYQLIGRLQLKIPILGNYIKRIYLIQFSQAMALLTNAKIPVVSGIALTRDMIRFYPLQQSLVMIEKDLINGTRINESFAKHSLYDKKMIALLRVAEETNQTEFIFQKLYEKYNTELQHKGQIMTSVFNFLLTILVGAIVGIILVAMYLPMFKLSSVIG